MSEVLSSRFSFEGIFKSKKVQRIKRELQEKLQKSKLDKSLKVAKVLKSTYKISKLLPIGSTLVCADNSGAKILQVIGYHGHQGTRKRRLTGGVGALAVVRVVKGVKELKKKKHLALIIRQKACYTRIEGPFLGKIRFEDNAAILLEPNGDLRKSVVKGPVAREICRHKKYSQMNVVYR